MHKSFNFICRHSSRHYRIFWLIQGQKNCRWANFSIFNVVNLVLEFDAIHNCFNGNASKKATWCLKSRCLRWGIKYLLFWLLLFYRYLGNSPQYHLTRCSILNFSTSYYHSLSNHQLHECLLHMQEYSCYFTAAISTIRGSYWKQ